jgi:MinD superfamily P-loop ATPase
MSEGRRPASLIQLVILSGKGGTGKTAVTGALAHLALQTPSIRGTVLVDADVDAANLEILLRPVRGEETEFVGGAVARIDTATCLACGICLDVCRFGAVKLDGDQVLYEVDPLACEGCAACYYQCPEEAIRMIPQTAGHWFASETAYGPLFHARLRAAQENSGKLVSLVKERARETGESQGAAFMIVDGPPGIGCPAIAASSGADLALIVTEPTMAGLHDLERAVQLTKHFRLNTLVAVNKADLYPAGAEAIVSRCEEWGVETAGTIPYDEAVPMAMVQRHPVTEHAPDSPASVALRALWTRVTVALEKAGLSSGAEEILRLRVHPRP